jgi:hypothetical protein
MKTNDENIEALKFAYYIILHLLGVTHLLDYHNLLDLF